MTPRGVKKEVKMRGKNILIVDDEKKIVEILANFLEMEGFKVMKTYDGQEALELLLADTPIDLMLLDEKMPVMGGTTLMREMRKRGMDIPIIVLTGSISITQRASSDKEGLYTNLLVKPVRLSELLDMVNRVLKESAGKGQKKAKKKKKAS